MSFWKNTVLIADNGVGMPLPNNSKVQELSGQQLQLEIKGGMALDCNWCQSYANSLAGSGIV